MASRDYQERQINDAIEAVSTKKKVIIQLPTGGGKTYEFALITQRFVRSTGQSVLILVDRIELMHQARKTIKKVCDIDAYLITSKTKQFQIGRVFIGMVESVVTRTHLFDNVGLVIIDECHVANFNKVHNLFLEELIIGFTATPVSSSKRNPLNRYYNDIIVGPQISELIEFGFLAKNSTRVPEEAVKAAALAVDKMTGDYNEKQMYEEYKKPKHVANVVQQYQRFCLGKKTIIYNVNKEHSKQVNAAFCMMGLNSRHLDSDATEEERAETIQWFKITEDAILNNVGLFTRGFDEPTIINVIINFSTLSIPKFLQCCGRGGRIIDGEFISNYQKDYPYTLNLKYHFNIIDLGGNAVSGIGDWSNDRDWREMFFNPEIPGDGIAPTKICPACSGLVHAAVRVCPLQKEDFTPCGYEFEKKKIAEEEDMKMVLITKEVDIPYLIYKNSKKHPYYNFIKMGEEVVNKVFNKFKNPSETILQKAFVVYYEMCIKWYNETLGQQPGNIKDITFSDWHIKRARNNFDECVKLKRENAIPYDYSEIAPIINITKKYDYLCANCYSNVKEVGEDGVCDNCKTQLAGLVRSF